MLAEILLGETANIPIQFTNASGLAVNPDAGSIVCRVYDEDGLVQNITPTKFQSGPITSASNPSGTAIILTADNDLTTYMRVSTSGISGHSVAGVNGDHEVVGGSATTINLSTVGDGGTTGTGGTWWVTGFYKATIVATIGNGYEKGKVYTMLVTYEISSTSYSEVFTFIVV